MAQEKFQYSYRFELLNMTKVDFGTHMATVSVGGRQIKYGLYN